MSKKTEMVIEKLLLLSAVASILIVFIIILFIFHEGWPIFTKYGLKSFLLGHQWYPEDNIFGIFPMIVGTFYVTLGALLMGVPLGLGCAIFLAEFAPPRLARLIRPGIELLAAIPSVVYGFWGMMVIVPFVRTYLGGPGYSILTGAIILAVMILPTIINISEDSLRAVPREYKEGSLAVGANHWQTIKKISLPTAKSGIIAAVVLGMGRAVGETMAVIMVVGNVTAMPGSILDPVRTLTANVALEMGYASGDHSRALFATGIVLFLTIMFINLLVNMIPGGVKKE